MLETSTTMEELSKEDYKAQATFRYAIRRFLRLSENNARAAGITPQQYQLLLAVKSMEDRDWATVSEIAESLQILHHSTVGLCKRAEQLKLIKMARHDLDRRQVCVYLTKRGEKILASIAKKNRLELERMREDITQLFLKKPLVRK
ncbi:MAG: helix-turn-helix domain-containing protein [Acidobacteriota bacterium]